MMQFTLKKMFIATTLVACLLGWLGRPQYSMSTPTSNGYIGFLPKFVITRIVFMWADEQTCFNFHWHWLLTINYNSKRVELMYTDNGLLWDTL